MRKIRLSDADAELFEEEMIPSDFEFLSRHKDTFCRMWSEQGNLFWKRFLEVFRSYIVRNRQSLLGLGGLSFDIMRLQHTLDFSFKIIEKSFVEGKVNAAKQLLYQIADLGRNRCKFQFLESKSRSKDPFYTKDTRDLFRYFFGDAHETLSYIRVRLLTPVYMRFGGSAVRCIMRWKEATDMDPSDDSYFTPPEPIESKPFPGEIDPSTMMCSHHLEDCKMKFQKQLEGTPSSPISLDFWPGGDPRFEVPGNPLYNQYALSSTDWRQGLDIKKFQEFYVWCSHNLVSPEDQCQDCHARKKFGKKNKKKKKKANAAAEAVPSTGVDDDLLSSAADSGRPSSVRDDLLLDDSVPMDPAIAKVHADLRAILDKSESMAEEVAQEIQNYAETELRGLLDDSIAKDVSNRFRRRGLHSSLKDLDSGTTLCCGKHIALPAATNASHDNGKTHCCLCLSAIGSLNDIDVEEDHSSVPSAAGDSNQVSSRVSGVVNSAGAAPPSMEERVKLLEAQTLVFPNSATVSNRKEEVLMPADNGRDIKAIFEICKTSDNVEALPAEVQVTLQELYKMDMNDRNQKEPTDSNKRMELGKGPLPPLTSQHLSNTVEGFPNKTLCAETEDWCGVEVNYSEEERHFGKATNFILKISKPHSAPDLNLAKHVMIQLLWYVVRRKKRPSLGWMMSEEDIFTFCQTLSGSLEHMIGMRFTITLLPPTQSPLSTQLQACVNKVKAAFDSDEFNLIKKSDKVKKEENSCTTNNKQDTQTTPIMEKNPKENDITPSKPDGSEKKQAKQSDGTAAPAASDTDKVAGSNPESTPAGQTLTSVAAAALEKATSTSASASASVDDGSEGGDTASTGKSKKKKKKNKSKAESVSNGGENTESKLSGAEKTVTSKTKAGEKQDGKAIVVENTESMSNGAEKQDTKTQVGEKPEIKTKGKQKKGSKAAGGQGTANGATALTPQQKGGQLVPQTNADRQALANCKTRDELAVVLRNMDEAGKTGPLNHTVVRAPKNPANKAETDAAFRILMQSLAAGGGLTTAGGIAIGDNKSGGYRQKSKCSYCGVVEPAIRTYKKCSRCKQESVANARYYCGRPCQLEDWKYRHNLEHHHGIFF